jgi:hypothetical protein
VDLAALESLRGSDVLGGLQVKRALCAPQRMRTIYRRFQIGFLRARIQECCCVSREFRLIVRPAPPSMTRLAPVISDAAGGPSIFCGKNEAVAAQ